MIKIKGREFSLRLSRKVPTPPIPPGDCILLEDPVAIYCVGDGERYGRPNVWALYKNREDQGWVPISDPDLETFLKTGEWEFYI